MDAQRFDIVTKYRNLGILVKDPREFRNSGTLNIREITYCSLGDLVSDHVLFGLENFPSFCTINNLW